MIRKKLKNTKNGYKDQYKQTKTKLNVTSENDLTSKSKTRKMLNDLHDDLSNSSIQRRKFLMNSNVARALTFHNTMTSSIKKNYMSSKSKMTKRCV